MFVNLPVGKWFSFSSNNDDDSIKTCDTNGEINNNVLIANSNPIDVLSTELVIIDSIFAAINFFEFFFLYNEGFKSCSEEDV